MEFTFPVAKIFKDKITKVKNDLVPEGFSDPGPFGRQCPQYVAQVVDALGNASAGAQGLAHPVTTADRLRNSDHTMYVMVDNSSGTKNGRIVGFLKTGYKNLYLYDKNGHNHETKPLCVLDFFIHDALQRRGLGKELFDHMLRDADISPKHLALDRPSDTFMSFVRKHYGLFKTIPQVNHYAIYDDFFSKRQDGKSQYLSRLHGRTSLRGGRQPLARRGVPAVTGQQHNVPQHHRQQHQQSRQSSQQQHYQHQYQQYPQQHQMHSRQQQQHELPKNQLQQSQQHPMHQHATAQPEPPLEEDQQHIQALYQLPPTQHTAPDIQQNMQQQLAVEQLNQQLPQSDTLQQPQQQEPLQQQHTAGPNPADQLPQQPQPQQQAGQPQQQQPTDSQLQQQQPPGSQAPQQPQCQQQQVVAQIPQLPAAGRLWADGQRSSVGECLTYRLAGNRWGPNVPAPPYVPRPAAGKASMIPTPNGPVMLVPPEVTADGPHIQGGQPPMTPCSVPGTPGAAPPPSALVAGGDGCGVPPGVPAPPGAAPAQMPPHPLDKNASPTAYELMRKSKYSHTPLW